MSAAFAAVLPRAVPKARQATWGYFVWIVAASVIVIPELLAAVSVGLPFTTISTMTGHLERHHDWVELIVVGIIVFVVFSLVKLSPRNETKRNPGEPQRTPGGRLTARPEAAGQGHDRGHVRREGRAAVVRDRRHRLACPDRGRHLGHGSLARRRVMATRAAYVLYGLLAVGWLVAPTVQVLQRGRSAVSDVVSERAQPHGVAGRRAGGPGRSGRAWPGPLATSSWPGLVILLLHLTLYPYPNITKILNPKG